MKHLHCDDLTAEKSGAHKQRQRIRDRIREIARAEGMSSGLEAVMVFLHMEDLREKGSVAI